MIKADVFCYLNNVQYKKNEWQNRNQNEWPCNKLQDYSLYMGQEMLKKFPDPLNSWGNTKIA
jgi:hypothetical protein